MIKVQKKAPLAATKSGDDTIPHLVPAKDGVTVRLYRTGHGDCFLLAFPGQTDKRPCYVLIDCGYKPGSPKYVETKIGDIAKHIIACTDGYIDVVVLTHEHQDHINGFTKGNFDGLNVGACWMAWTENPDDDQAEKLRVRFKDYVLTLLAARQRLAAAGGDAGTLRRLDDLLAFEWGGDEEGLDVDVARSLLGAAGGKGVSLNKTAMKFVQGLAKDGTHYLAPHEDILAVPGARDVRAFVLGPPRDETLLNKLDPEGDEEFIGLAPQRMSAASYFASAVASENDPGQAPFAGRYCLPLDVAVNDPFFVRHYGKAGAPPAVSPDSWTEAPDDAPWRRIDQDWLGSAEQFALNMNDYTNNTSLVLAFELGRGGKVLLFAADAQRGNWLSWSKGDWKDGDTVVTARDLLARTVLYKVGHHGSHNATLNGTLDDDHPNLAWMGQGSHAGEFTAMITAVRAWAETQKGWDHPLKAIKDALLKKTSGRVFQSDTRVNAMSMQGSGPQAAWQGFLGRTEDERLYVDYKITL